MYFFGVSLPKIYVLSLSKVHTHTSSEKKKNILTCFRREVSFFISVVDTLGASL